jgi:hypothetical protein
MVVSAGPGAAAATPTPLKAVGRTPRTAATSLARVDENAEPSAGPAAPVAAALDFSDDAGVAGRVAAAATASGCVPMDTSDSCVDAPPASTASEDVLLSCTLPLSTATPLGMFIDKPDPDAPPVITAVDPDGPAAAAGVKAGYILVRFGSTPVWSSGGGGGGGGGGVSMGSMHLSQLIWSAQAAAAAYGGKVVEVTFQAPAA